MTIKKFIGDKKFYRMLLVVVIPIIIQNGITNFVSLLDNIMVGQIGTEQMSGVAIVNQLIFVFNLCIFGGVSGAGIFTAQYYGFGDHKGVRETVRFKLIAVGIICVICITIFMVLDDQLISLYLHQSEGEGNIAATLVYSKKYLKIMLLGLVPFGISQVYAGTLRETGQTLLPMIAGVIAVLVNLVFNWFLIFGNLGFPELGVEGAAIATVMSRYVEAAVVVAWTHRNRDKNVFVAGLYKSLHIDSDLVKNIMKKGTPLLANELLWSLGVATTIQCYSVRGLNAIAAVNISSTLSNLAEVVMLSMGNAIAIIIGNLLGANKLEEARDSDNKMTAATFVACILVGALLFISAPMFPKIYNTSDGAMKLATNFIRITAILMPISSLNYAFYFTLRAGGKTFLALLLDSAFIWLVAIPPAYLLAHYTGLSIVVIYAIVQSLNVIKCIIGFAFVKKRSWIRNIL